MQKQKDPCFGRKDNGSGPFRLGRINDVAVQHFLNFFLFQFPLCLSCPVRPLKLRFRVMFQFEVIFCWFDSSALTLLHWIEIFEMFDQLWVVSFEELSDAIWTVPMYCFFFFHVCRCLIMSVDDGVKGMSWVLALIDLQHAESIGN